MKFTLVTFLSFFTLSTTAQLSNKFEDSLTSKSSQNWLLDSIGVRDGYNTHFHFVKGTKLQFTVAENSVVIKAPSKVAKKSRWGIKVSRYATLEVDGMNRFEIDFFTRRGTYYMRLRDEIGAQKNIFVTEYYFVKSN